MKYLYTLIVFISLLSTSCYQEDGNKYTDTSSSIKLTKTPLNYGATFHWSESNVSTFVEYIVTKNTQSTPAFSSVADLQSNTIVARIRSRSLTSITDTTTVDNSYYRVYVNIGHGLLASNEEFVDFLNFPLVGLSVLNYLVDHVNGNLYLFYSNRTIEVVDLNNMKVKVVKTEQAYNFNLSPSLGYDQSGKTEIYIPHEDKIIFFDGDNLEPKDTLYGITKGASIYNTATDKFGNIYYTDSYSGSLAVVAKFNPSTGKSIRFGDVIRNIMLRVTQDGKYVLVATQDFAANASLYTFIDNDVIISNIKSQSSIDFSSNTTCIIANYGPTIISGSSGMLYEKLNDKLLRLTTLSTAVPSYFSSSFSSDDKFIYATSTSQKSVVKIENKNPYNKVMTYKTRLFPLYFFIYNNEAYAITKINDQFTGLAKLFLEKIKL